MKTINTYTSTLYTVQLMSFYLKQKDVIIGIVIVYILEKESFCLVCKFNRDLTTYYETEQEIINRKSKILKIYRALMTFIYMVRYWNIISPHLMSNFLDRYGIDVLNMFLVIKYLLNKKQNKLSFYSLNHT